MASTSHAAGEDAALQVEAEVIAMARSKLVLDEADLKKTSLDEVRAELEDHAREHGFTASGVTDMVDVVLSVQRRRHGSDLGPSKVASLNRASVAVLKNLWPSSHVTEEAVLKLMGSMMSFPHSLQLASINW